MIFPAPNVPLFVPFKPGRKPRSRRRRSGLATGAIASLVALHVNLPLPVRAGPEVDHAALGARALTVLEAQFGAFRQASLALVEASEAFCAGGMARTEYLGAFEATWLAWAPLDAYQFGPVEQRGAVLTVGFWPDKKDFVGRGLTALMAAPPAAQADATAVAGYSAAVQGLPAIARLMSDDRFAPCPAVRGISGHVAAVAVALHDDWFAPGGWAALTRDAGPLNPVYLNAREVTKALYTAVDFELSRIADLRLARPLGRFDAPQPDWAEGRRVGLSLAIIDAQLAGIAQLVEDGFGAALSEPGRVGFLDTLAQAREAIARIGAPLDEAVNDPMTRIRVEGLQSRINGLRAMLAEVIGAELGVETGFSPADGD